MVSQGQPSKLQDQSSNIACYQVANIAGAGRGLVAVKSIKAGALVLREAPLLLTPSQDMHTFVCANCLRFARGKWSSKLNFLGTQGITVIEVYFCSRWWCHLWLSASYVLL